MVIIKRKGFSLIEILVSMVFLATILSMGISSYNDYVKYKSVKISDSINTPGILVSYIEADINLYGNINFNEDSSGKLISINVGSNCDINYFFSNNDNSFTRYLDCANTSLLKDPVNTYIVSNIADIDFIDEGSGVYTIKIFKKDTTARSIPYIFRVDKVGYKITYYDPNA